jgi:hypothetical protein
MRIGERIARLEKAMTLVTTRPIKLVQGLLEIDNIDEWVRQVSEAESARATQAVTGIIDLTWRREGREPKNLTEVNALLTYAWLDHQFNDYGDCRDVIIAKLKQAGGVEVEVSDAGETALPAMMAVRIKTEARGELTFAL